jgi:hypothetical protein
MPTQGDVRDSHGKFKKGMTSWLKGVKGVRQSPRTEFKPGELHPNWIKERICKVINCESNIKSKGYCTKHYLRWWRYGDTSYVKNLKGKAIDRFYFMIDKTNTCWNWKGSLDKGGYGRIADDEGWNDMAHRWSYKNFVGDIPDGLVLDHICKNTKCVNPKHLRPVTHKQNIIDYGVSNASFLNSQKTHCIHNHELSLDNIYIYKGKRGATRVCKICHSKRVKEYIKRKMENNENN